MSSMSYMPMNIFMAAIDNMVFFTFPFGLLLLINFIYLFILIEVIPLRHLVTTQDSKCSASFFPWGAVSPLYLWLLSPGLTLKSVASSSKGVILDYY